MSKNHHVRHAPNPGNRDGHFGRIINTRSGAELRTAIPFSVSDPHQLLANTAAARDERPLASTCLSKAE